MIVGIDGSNIRSGGAVTYFSRMLAHADPERFGVQRVVVWGDRVTLDLLPQRPWLDAVHVPRLEGSQLARLLWQRFQLPRTAREGCDLLFVPGGLVTGGFRPYVTMSRNMLPFEYPELFRYGLSPVLLRLLLLRWGQGRSIRRADGVIFLTRYACETVSRKVRPEGEVIVIPHGVDERFRSEPRVQEPIEAYSKERPLRILYISIVDVYKHPWHLAEAVARLRSSGLPVALDLVGPAYPPALARLRETLQRLDPEAAYLRYRGAASFEELVAFHAEAQIFAFASSCENMPNILVEAMAAAHPIACARRGPMPEILGDAGTYFDPERPEEIEAALRALVVDPARRARASELASRRAEQFTWTRCAAETFDFMARIGRAHGISSARTTHIASAAG